MFGIEIVLFPKDGNDVIVLIPDTAVVQTIERKGQFYFIFILLIHIRSVIDEILYLGGYVSRS